MKIQCKPTHKEMMLAQHFFIMDHTTSQKKDTDDAHDMQHQADD